MNEPKQLRNEARSLQQKADAMEHIPMTDEQWGLYHKANTHQEAYVKILHALNDALTPLHNESRMFRNEALYWREKCQEIAAPPETPDG